MMPLFLLLSLGCWSPKVTGPSSMVGVVQDPEGQPIAGLSVETLESRWITDEQGRFGVNYKAPAQWLHFQHEGAWYKRTYRGAADDGADVVIRLPAAETDVPLRCLHETCDAKLDWDLGDGLSATVRVRCDNAAEERARLPLVAGKLPDSATCTAPGPSTDAQPLLARRVGTALQLSPPPAEVDLPLTTTGDTLPGRCVVRADGLELPTKADGVYAVRSFGRVTIDGHCDDVPFTPKPMYIVGPGVVPITWTARVPLVDLRRTAPGASELLLMAKEDSGSTWETTLPIKANRVKLPPLPPGTYKVGLRDTWEHLRSVNVVEDTPANELQLIEMPFTDDAGKPVFVGVLRVPDGLTEGPVRASMYEGP